jgi:predicted ArsR family transcriptional regulator
MDGDAARDRESCRCVPEHVQRPCRQGHGQPEEVKAAAQRERVLSVVATLEENATSKEIAAKVELPEPTVRRYLKTLLEGEHFVRTGEGRKNDAYRRSLDR